MRRRNYEFRPNLWRQLKVQEILSERRLFRVDALALGLKYCYSLQIKTPFVSEIFPLLMLLSILPKNAKKQSGWQISNLASRPCKTTETFSISGRNTPISSSPEQLELLWAPSSLIHNEQRGFYSGFKVTAGRSLPPTTRLIVTKQYIDLSCILS